MAERTYWLETGNGAGADVPVITPRCSAARSDDTAPCSGPMGVTVVDTLGREVEGCERHTALLLASLEGDRVDPRTGHDATATRVHDDTQALPPFGSAPTCEAQDAGLGPCRGPRAVVVTLPDAREVRSCVAHAAALYRTHERSRVRSLPGHAYAAIEVFMTAGRCGCGAVHTQPAAHSTMF